MDYLVLARKFRPQAFSEVIGQEHVTKTLENGIKQGRIPHAFLFTGPRGVGKTSAARILAKVLSCPNVKEGSIPCQECPSCKEISQGISMDVMEIDGASNNGVDSIRELRENAAYLPARGKRRVYIIDEVHMLSQSAFNALLKILEEPPPHLTFIFATTEPRKIPPTVISRCQRHDFKKIADRTMSQYLSEIAAKEGVNVTPDAVNLIAQSAEGSLRDALSLLDQVICYAGQSIGGSHVRELLGLVEEEFLLELVQAILERKGKETLALLDQAYGRGVDLYQLSQSLTMWLRHLALIKLDPQGTLLLSHLSPTTKGSLQKQAAGHKLTLFIQLLHITSAGSEQIQKSPHPKLFFEVLLLKLVEVPSLVSVEEILATMRQMESTSLSMVPQIPAQEAPSPQLVTNFPEISLEPFLKFLKGKKHSLAALIEEGKILQIEENCIHLQVPNNPFIVQQLKDSEYATTIENYANEFFQKKLRIQFSFSSENKGAPAATSAATHSSSNPIEMAQNLLQGNIKDVRVYRVPEN